MDAPTMRWLKANLHIHETNGSHILEVGSMDVNGSIRHHISEHLPQTYTGVDIQAGPGVDLVLDSRDLVKRFGINVFDMVISTEMLEHVEHWEIALQEMKDVLQPGGTLILTTRAPGFPRHCYPYDYWRFTEQNLRDAMQYFDIIDCRRIAGCGVVIKARKTIHQRHVDLRRIKPLAAPMHELRWSLMKLWVFIAYQGRNPSAKEA